MIQTVFKLPLLTILTITCRCDGLASRSVVPRYRGNDSPLSQQKHREKLISRKSLREVSNEMAEQATSTTIPTRPRRTPLSVFNDDINDKIEHADNIHEESKPENANVVVIDFTELMYMAFADATSEEMQIKRKEFARRISSSGNYCLVKFEEIEASIINGMWDCVDAIFSHGVESSAESLPFRHQTLKRDRHDSTADSCLSPSAPTDGYQFVQTAIIDDKLYPLDFIDRVGQDGYYKGLRVYQMLSQLCKAFACILYSGVTGTQPLPATQLIASLLDDDGRSFSGSYHRLCQYVKVSDEKAAERGSWSESLRSHVDWTVSTAIPVSAIAGLEIYDPVKQQWICPEKAAKQHWEKTEAASHDSGSSTFRWNSYYAIMMSGAWLELLTQSDVEATVHRVVADRSTFHRQRQSAPFFMRPRELVFRKVDELFDDRSKQYDGDVDLAKECIGNLLKRNFERSSTT